MKWKGYSSTTIAKVVVGGLLIGGGIFLGFRSSNILDSKGYSVSVAHAQLGPGAQSTYCANWQATKLLAVEVGSFPNKDPNFSSNNLKRLFAIGPAQWTVTYTNGAQTTTGCSGTTLATETWNVPSVSGLTCNTGAASNQPFPGSSACDGEYLNGLVNGDGTGYQAMKYSIVNPSAVQNDPTSPGGVDSYTNDLGGTFCPAGTDGNIAYNNSFTGPGALAATAGTLAGDGIFGYPSCTLNPSKNFNFSGGFGWYSSGAYGWSTADVPNNDTAQLGSNTPPKPADPFYPTSGLMMPLQWNVSGTLDSN